MFTHARVLKREYLKGQDTGLAGRREERLAALLRDPNRRSVIGPIQLQYRTREVVYREGPDGTFKLDLKTPWPADQEVTIIDRDGDDDFTVIVRDKDAVERLRRLLKWRSS